MHKSGGWIEPVLTRHLGPATAPDELRRRIENAQKVPGTSSRSWFSRTAGPGSWAWALVCSLLIGGVLLGSRRGAAGNEALAVEALARTPEHIEFRSDSPGEIRAWVKVRTGLDIPLPAEEAGTAQLIGAHVFAGNSVVELAYRVRNCAAALLVAKANAGVEYRFLRAGAYQGVETSSWTMRGQIYTIAYAGPDARLACALCHAGPG